MARNNCYANVIESVLNVTSQYSASSGTRIETNAFRILYYYHVVANLEAVNVYKLSQGCFILFRTGHKK